MRSKSMSMAATPSPPQRLQIFHRVRGAAGEWPPLPVEAFLALPSRTA
jgi:hypothetical protein